MRNLILAVVLAATSAGWAQTPADEDFHVYRDAPRLLLTQQRLRLLQREHDRQSARWEQFDALLSGGAPVPEPGFAWALYYQVARQDTAVKRAVDWALDDKRDASDLRQMALVFDWCGPVMTKAQSTNLGAKIARLITTTPQNAAARDVGQQSARVLAAIAIADQLPDQGDAILRDVVQKWWRGSIVPQLAAGRQVLPREQRYALYEMLHALRDNLQIDLRETAAGYFQELPIAHMTGHYPAPFAAPENEYMIPAYLHAGNPDPAEAAMSRAAGLALVAYDTNSLQSQLLQGWLLRDRFMMRGSLGAVYEFLWANPYQPGLNYDQVPLVFHGVQTGELFARTSWDEDATWIGFFQGRLQLFQNGSLQTLKEGSVVKPTQVGSATIASASAAEAAKFRVENQTLFVVGLAPQSAYAVEVDDQELELRDTDGGGTLMVPNPRNADVGVRVRLRGASWNVR